jgi:hypothetical protein
MKIYVAGPYSADPAVCTQAAIVVADLVIEAGHEPFIPHLYYHVEKFRSRHYEVWMKIDLAFLGVCDLVVRMPGHSPGADREVEAAERLNIPVMSLHAFTERFL